MPCSKSKRRSYPSSTSTSTLATTIYLRFYVRNKRLQISCRSSSPNNAAPARITRIRAEEGYFLSTLFFCCSHEPATLPKALASLVGTSPLAALLLPLPGIIESGPCVTTNGHIFVSALGHRRRSRRNAKHTTRQRDMR